MEDAFGTYFQEHIFHGHNGQFFTPAPLSDMMAKIVNPVGEGLRMLDPCCGSGSLILSADKVNREQEFFGGDLSEMCCKMTLINMCLNDLIGKIYHMNTLTMETWRAWRVYRWPITHHPFIMELTIVEDPSPEPAVKPALDEVANRKG